MNEEEIKIFIDEYYKLKNIQNSIKEIDKDFFFNLVDKLLYLYNKEKENNEYLKNHIYNPTVVKLNYISKDKIRGLKEFYINDYKNRNITLIPLENLIKNINKLLED